ncbi:hypothetical protein LCGC14_2316410, partial [marine sediment metagenome]
FYAVQIPIKMSRQILGLERGDKRQADHINHNTLDNCRVNLRVCTIQENQMNQKPRSNTTSNYKGVSWNKQTKKWVAFIGVNTEAIYLGCFTLERNAAEAYNRAAKIYHKEFACLNQI